MLTYNFSSQATSICYTSSYVGKQSTMETLDLIKNIKTELVVQIADQDKTADIPRTVSHSNLEISPWVIYPSCNVELTTWDLITE